MPEPDITLRSATAQDHDAIIDLAAASLGWKDGEPNRELFNWKHLENVFGASPMWVAESEGRLAGFRALMRWDLRAPTGEVVKAVRAVDTATHPDFQRKGIFSRLTLRAIEDLAAVPDGPSIIFNTPNDQSRPGYLKMDWADVGRLPVAVRPLSLRSPLRLLRARVPAHKWSEPTSVGLSIAGALAQPGLDELLDAQPESSGHRTVMSSELLGWRYGFAPLRYRVFAPDGVASGMVIFRVRKRGGAVEGVVNKVFAPGGSREAERSLLSRLGKVLASGAGADYLIRIGEPDVRGMFFPVPNQGPRLTVRTITATPPTTLAEWDLHLGDIELF